MSYRTWQPRSPPLKKLHQVHVPYAAPAPTLFSPATTGSLTGTGVRVHHAKVCHFGLKVISFLLSPLNLKARPKVSSVKSPYSVLERVKWLNHYSPKEKELASVCIANLPKKPLASSSSPHIFTFPQFPTPGSQLLLSGYFSTIYCPLLK